MSKVYNHDVAGICRKIDRFIIELNKSSSSGSSVVNQFDAERLASFLAAWEKYVAWIQGQPHLDLVESHPHEYDVPVTSDEFLIQVENESINDAIRLLSLCKEELINSQSSRDASRLNDFDLKRHNSLIGKIKSLLTEYIAVATPLDFPESSPRDAMSGAGRTGV